MQRLIAIVLSVFLLFSSSGITYAQHFCGDFLMSESLSLGKTHLSCGMQQEVDPCQAGSEEPMGCCENQYTTVDVDDSFVKATYQFNVTAFDFAVVPAFNDLSVNLFEAKLFTAIPQYRPPPDSKDFQIFFQVFLI